MLRELKRARRIMRALKRHFGKRLAHDELLDLVQEIGRALDGLQE